MTYAAIAPDVFIPLQRGRLRRRGSRWPLIAATALCYGALAALWTQNAGPEIQPHVPVGHHAVPPVRGTANPFGALLDPASPIGFAPVPLSQSSPLATAFAALHPAMPPVTVAETDAASPLPLVPEVVESASPAPSPLPRSLPLPPQVAETVPLPAARPTELRGPAPASHGSAVRAPGRRMAQQARPTVPAAAAPDNRSFIEKLFGMGLPPAPALAYATPDDGIFGAAHRLTSGPAAAYDRWTAVYDIAAHTVYMPDGSRLEAHSGLGDKLDDPRHVSVQNRGPTPPHAYDLAPREQLFHGVQALRLNPIGGGDLFGRNGLLAHTYMLGPNGDSNGCVSFKDYNAFLRAYQNGDVKRLVVVARLM